MKNTVKNNRLLRGISALLVMACMFAMAACAFAEAPAAAESFVMEYPEDMQALGFTEPLVLDAVPQRIVCLSAAPVLALYEMGASLVGIPTSRVVTWPEELVAATEPVQFSAMSSSDFDYECIVSLEADLVLVGSSSTEVGKQIESLGIPVYYVFAGHTVSYDNIKAQTEALVKAFSLDEASTAKGEEIMSRFTALEERLASVQPTYADKKVMVLQSSDTANHYIQTERGTLASIAAMMGFGNVYENETASMAKLDMPIRDGYAREVFIVSSGEMMALYAANNIAQAVRNFAGRGYARLGGLILNTRNTENERETVAKAAEEIGIDVIQYIPRCGDIQKAEAGGGTVFECLEESPMHQVYNELAQKILAISIDAD